MLVCLCFRGVELTVSGQWRFVFHLARVAENALFWQSETWCACYISPHNRDDVRMRDEERDSKLRALGWDILRIPNDIAFHPDHLITLVREYLGIE